MCCLFHSLGETFSCKLRVQLTGDGYGLWGRACEGMERVIVGGGGGGGLVFLEVMVLVFPVAFRCRLSNEKPLLFWEHRTLLWFVLKTRKLLKVC